MSFIGRIATLMTPQAFRFRRPIAGIASVNVDVTAKAVTHRTAKHRTSVTNSDLEYNITTLLRTVQDGFTVRYPNVRIVSGSIDDTQRRERRCHS